MNYEFHVGDYVETRDGKVGYIYYFRPNVLVFKTQDGGQYEISTDVLDWGSHPENIFNRIGAYDFTKKEKKKIEPISDYNKHIVANAIKSDSQLVRTVIDDIWNKINELVDAVNKLMDKEDKNDKTTM